VHHHLYAKCSRHVHNVEPILNKFVIIGTQPLTKINIHRNYFHYFICRWVNEGYKEPCLELAEELANQTPVRLDVLLSLSPPSVTADQLVVQNPEEDKTACERIVRSHSVGSVIDMPTNTEAERRIIDMVFGEC
jgi:hypothetical protein